MQRLSRIAARLRSRYSRRQRVWLGVAIAAAVLVIVQLCYPYNRLPWYSHIGGIDVSGNTFDQAYETVSGQYRATSIDVYFGAQSAPYVSPTLDQVGGHIERTEIDKYAYTWWQRLLPGSLWWAGVSMREKTPRVIYDTLSVESYVKSELGASCDVKPKNATLELQNDALVVKSAEKGGTCELSDIVTGITSLQPLPQHTNEVRIALDEMEPELNDAVAEQLLQELNQRLAGDTVAVRVNNSTVTLPTKTLLSWLVFTEKDGKLVVSVDPTRAQKDLVDTFSKTVAVAAGTVTITTRDFVEVSRSGGGDGRALDVTATAQQFTKYVRGEQDELAVQTKKVAPAKKYVRTYSPSDTGLSALMKNFATDNPGVYGVSLRELSGQRRNASYQADRQFITASTYKLYVAISTLRRVDSGAMNWNQQIDNGRNLATCFDDMIVNSDNACAEALVKKIGYRPLHNDAQSIGATNTTFLDTESFKTTAGDLTLVLAQLQTGQLPISDASRDRLLSALKRNVYRQGIPAGVPSATVADKVGFLDALLHDTAIVYTSSGTYVLTVMSDKSSWANIAKLTRELESLRAQ